jgi:hypothetical protein
MTALQPKQKRFWRNKYLLILVLVASLLIAGVMIVIFHTGAKTIVPGVTPDNPILKIYIANEGVYKLSESQLVRMGLNITGVDPNQLQLSLRGVPVPLYFAKDEGEINLFFFARASESRYSAENIYLLTVLDIACPYTKEISQLAKAAGLSSGLPITEYQAVIHIEENILYFPQVTDGEHWFYRSLASGQQETFQYTITNLIEGAGNITISLWGNTQSQAMPDHHLVALINGQLIADIKWDGRGRRVISRSIPENLLTNGVNEITIEIPGDTDAGAEVNWLDWIEMTYPREAIAQSGSLMFELKSPSLLIQGFQGAVFIFDTQTGEIVEMQEKFDEDGIGYQFFGEVGKGYLAVDFHGINLVRKIEPYTATPVLQAGDEGAEYVCIGPYELLEPLEDYLRYRQAQGWSISSMPLQAIYDQYNYGFPEPQAIHKFLIDTWQRWKIKPRYLLLVGDASYDPRNFQNGEYKNILPTFFIDTVYGGETASDIPFTYLDNDELPDLALGRIPASTPDMVSIVVQKIIEYEEDLISGTGVNKILAVAGGDDPSFNSEAQNFLNYLNDGFSTNIFVPEPGSTESPTRIQEYFRDGLSFLGYFGHGGVIMWGKDRILTSEDAASLSNRFYPIVINMTCLTGFFTHPKTMSISEALLFNGNGGAVAIIAPTSLTLPSDQGYLIEGLATGIYNHRGGRLGDVLLTTQRQIEGVSLGIQDVINTYLLFGDPALLLP